MSSLAVLYRFIRWPEGVEDTIQDEESFSDEEIQKMVSFGPRGLGKLLSELKRLREEHKNESESG